MKDDSLLEALDSCRPGTDDLERADMAEAARHLAEEPRARQLYGRLQRADAKIAAAMHDAPVPEGLEARLLASLAEGVAAPPAPARPPNIRVESNVTGNVGWRRTARRWWPAGAGVAVAAALLAAFFLRADEEFLPHQVLEFALTFFDDDDHREGHLLADAPAPGGLPASRFIIAEPKTTRWHSVQGFIGRKGLAYDLRLRGGLEATLYVVPRRSLTTAPKLVGKLPLTPPDPPPSTTGGRAAGAWVENGLLYVLVVKGDAQVYRQFVHGAGAMAMRRSSEHATVGFLIAGA